MEKITQKIRYCPKCKRYLSTQKFYTHKDGRVHRFECKYCLTKNVKDNDPSTFLHLLKFFDIPFVANEWFPLVEHAKNKAVETGYYVTPDIHTIFGYYLSKMKLTGWKSYTFEDSEELNYFSNHSKYNKELNRQCQKVLEYFNIVGILNKEENK